MLSKKKSRVITVDECRYRWVISPASGYVVFVAESANDPARKVEVYIGSGINQMWLEFPSVDGLNLKVITSKDAAAIIRQALKLGWIPDERGAPLCLTIVRLEVFPRGKFTDVVILWFFMIVFFIVKFALK